MKEPLEPKIDLYVVVSTDREKEGVVAELINDKWIPYITSRKENVERLYKAASVKAHVDGRQVKVVKFKRVEE